MTDTRVPRYTGKQRLLATGSVGFSLLFVSLLWPQVVLSVLVTVGFLIVLGIYLFETS